MLSFVNLTASLYSLVSIGFPGMNDLSAQIDSVKPLESVRVLLSQLIDYAGLFPPSQLSMTEAVLNYATYRNSNFGWMLGRFVLPAARLDEFLEVARDFVSREGKPWQLAVVAGEDINDTFKRIKLF